MPNNGKGRWILLGAVLMALVGGGGVLICCLPESAPALPAGCAQDQPARTTAELQTCLAGLEFDELPAAGDRQRLMIYDPGPGPGCPGADSIQNCRYGPLATIQPLKGSHKYDDDDLAEGRIIARMFVDSEETQGYPKFNLTPADTTYWWVRKHASPDSAKSVFVSTATGQHMDSLVTLTRPLEVEPHPDGFKQGLASWVWVPDDEKANGSCGQACCR
jgi:hypothetical protein